MGRAILLLGLATGLAGIGLVNESARAEAVRLALIIGNAHYTAMAALPQCAASATVVRDALSAKGFEIIERNDVARGEFDAAIGTLARRMTSAPDAVVAVYYCGYAVEFNSLSFLFPVSANMPRESDVLTEGINAQGLVDSLTQAGDGAGFVLLDTWQSAVFAAN